MRNGRIAIARERSDCGAVRCEDALRIENESPAAENSTRGAFSFTARSAAAMIALPTYMPIEPAMKAKSCAAQTTFSRAISPSATSIASSSPTFLRASRSRSVYFF